MTLALYTRILMVAETLDGVADGVTGYEAEYGDTDQLVDAIKQETAALRDIAKDAETICNCLNDLEPWMKTLNDWADR